MSRRTFLQASWLRPLLEAQVTPERFKPRQARPPDAVSFRPKDLRLWSQAMPGSIARSKPWRLDADRGLHDRPPWTEWKIREQFRKVLGDEAYTAFFNAFDQAFIADADIAFLAQQGFNVVRIPFNYRHFENDMAPGQWIESGFRRLDRVVNLCRKHNLWVVLDLHAAPGAQARDQNAGSAYGESYLWYHREFIDRTCALWAEIARRYSGDATIAGYNLLCEPVTDNVPLLNEFYLKIIRSIRKADRNHLILLDPNMWAKEIATLHDELFADPQAIPSLHHYFSEDAGFAQPHRLPRGCRRKKLRSRGAREDARQQRRSAAHCPSRNGGRVRSISRLSPAFARLGQPSPRIAITRDLVSIFEEKGWSWTMWCYKDLRDMGMLTVAGYTVAPLS